MLQPVPGQPPPVQPSPAAPAPGRPATQPVTPPTALPPMPTIVVDDPMLAPIPPANRQLGSWGDALSLVRARSTDLATAYAEVRRAEAQTRTALAAVLPTINATATIPHQFITNETATFSGSSSGNTGAAAPVRTITTPQSNYLTANVQLQQSLVNLQAWQAIGTGKVNEKVQKLSAEDTNRTITLAVSTAIVGVVAAERVAELNRVGLRSSLERHELTVRKRGLGVATGLDVVRADQDVAAARATLVTGDEALRRAREALGLAVGIPEAVGVPPGVKLDDVMGGAEQSCPALKELAERPDIAAAQKRVEVAERNVHNVELSFLPTLSLGSTFSTTTQDTGAAPQATWNVQGILTVPIWDGGVRYGSLRSNRALRDEAGFALEAARRTATVEIQQARRNVGVAEASLEVARQTRQLAYQVDQLTQTAYRAGQGTSLELVIAASSLRQAEIELALREFDVVRARLEALFALARCSGTS
ncbi:TolC family protein [Labilithrix luteola]|uniref:TolC family protein n=1 Tax=Labilithrix luteola TaxID=1391654 RepID=UPI0011BA857D|nr:TolC family protein [Labilithrix luteola]